MSGYPRWIRREPGAEVRERGTSQLLDKMRARTTPPASMPKDLSERNSAEADCGASDVPSRRTA